MSLNPFDLLADLDGSTEYAREEKHTERKPKLYVAAQPAAINKPTCKATLFVHDNSNQKACSITVPAVSLASTRSLAKFLTKKGFAMPRTSLLTVHEDRVPCNLQVFPMNGPAQSLPIKSHSADALLHLFVAHDHTSDSLLQAFANVHPECYKTLAECAEQPVINTAAGPVPVDFQAYLEAAFEASVQTHSILYNDCDKTNLKAEWCTWNTGLLWKGKTPESPNNSGYIFLFFKRSLSRVSKDRIGHFSVDCQRQAKPWTMNKPKPISDVQQWLNGAAVPPPPPTELIANLISYSPAAVKPILTKRVAPVEDCAPCTPPLCEVVSGLSDLSSDCSCISHTLDAITPTHAASSIPSTLLEQPSSASKQGRHRRRRRRTPKPSMSETSSPCEPSTPTKDAENMEANIDELVAVLHQACSTASMQTCGWISSMASAGPGPLDWVL